MAHTQQLPKSDRHWRKWLPASQLLIGAAVLAGLVILLLHAGSISHEAITVIRHFKASRLPWLVLAVGAEAMSFLCYAFVQRNLLMEGGALLTRRDMARLAIAATGLTNLLPGGTAPSSGWLVAQYRKRGVPMPLALWAVLAGGFAATVSVLLLTLVGAAIAGLLSPVGLVLCAVLLVAGSTAFVAGARHLDAVDRWFRSRSHIRGRVDRLLHRLSQGMGDVSKFRTRPVVGARGPRLEHRELGPRCRLSRGGVPASRPAGSLANGAFCLCGSPNSRKPRSRAGGYRIRRGRHGGRVRPRRDAGRRRIPRHHRLPADHLFGYGRSRQRDAPLPHPEENHRAGRALPQAAALVLHGRA